MTVISEQTRKGSNLNMDPRVKDEKVADAIHLCFRGDVRVSVGVGNSGGESRF
jgi:hypothetical protein